MNLKMNLKMAQEIEADLYKKLEKLQSFIEMTPKKQTNSFQLISNDKSAITVRGLIKTDKVFLDQVKLNANSQTLWSIQKRAIQFVVYQGSLDLKFRVHDTVHTAGLGVTHSLQLRSGTPFKLETYESPCEVFLIAAKEQYHAV